METKLRVNYWSCWISQSEFKNSIVEYFRKTSFLDKKAAILGKKLAYKILDSDAEIERLEQTSIAEIFKKGESFFRDLETKFLLGLQNLENTVLSVGGGIIEREKNLTLLQKIGAIFFLEMPLDLLWQRIKEDKTRPKITQSESEEQNFLAFKNLYQSRLSQYQKADFTISIKTETPEQVADKIITIYKGLIEL